MENKDVIRVAVDLKLAWQFSNILKESRVLNNAGDDFGLESRALGSMTIRERLRDRVLREGSSRSEAFSHLDQAMQRYNMFLTSHNEMMMFNSPCKLRFAFNQSEFHEGADLHLLQMMLQANQGREAFNLSPLHLVVSVLEPGIEVQVSERCIYFDEWDMIPKEPFLFEKDAA